MEFVAMLECENWTFQLDRVWDSWHAFGICQMNDRFHKDIPSDYLTNWQRQVEYCYEKWKWGTKFYWPSRLIKGKKCSEYVKTRYTFIE